MHSKILLNSRYNQNPQKLLILDKEYDLKFTHETRTLCILNTCIRNTRFTFGLRNEEKSIERDHSLLRASSLLNVVHSIPQRIENKEIV